MRFGKNVLSQYLRTNCDLALYLTLFREGELAANGLPEALTARPGIGTLRDAGNEFELTVFNRLHTAFGDRCIGLRSTELAKWIPQPLEEQLRGVAATPCILVQPQFSVEPNRDNVLTRLGILAADLAIMPPFTSFIPDIAIIEAATPQMMELLPTGERSPRLPSDQRLAISLIDVKHAQEANPSYEAEVVLYGVLLANWLVDQGIVSRFFVTTTMGLWTRGGLARNAFQVAIDRGERDPVRLVEAVRMELVPISLPIYVQALRKFFAEKLPEVIRRGNANWTTLEWHVDNRCGSCDWLGYEGWLGPNDITKVAANPNHYCFPRAAQTDHLSRLPLLTRGSRRVLQDEGLQTVAAIALTTGAETVYGRHSKLKTDRRSIPGFAVAIGSSTTSADPDRPDGMLARYADLDIFISVNFDPGAGLLTGVGLQAYFRQSVPFGQAPANDRVSRKWRERWVVASKSAQAEESTLLAFLHTLATIFEFVSNTDPMQGGRNATDTRAQLVFWDHRQFEELCLSLGRHLPAILYDRQPRLVQALSWMFPPEELQETDAIDERRPAVAFVRDTVRRLIRVPALHALTLFNVVEHYHHGDNPFQPPDQFYREPLSDTIPRERIYEIWSLSEDGGRGNIRWGRVVKTHSQLIEGFNRTIDSQGFALSSIAWRLRHDFGGRLKAQAPKIRLVVPTWTTGVAHDSKLWVAWAKFESAFGKASDHLLFLADPEEAEASYKGLRLIRVLHYLGNGDTEWEVSVDSINTKIQAPDDFLCLSVDSIPGFLALPVWSVIAPAVLPPDLARLSQVHMHKLFKASLVHLNRAARTAVVRLSRFWGGIATDMLRLRQEVSTQIGPETRASCTLVPGLSNEIGVQRLQNILGAVGNPPNAVAAEETRRALGAANRQPRPGTSAVTPISRVLWEALTLHDSFVRSPEESNQIAVEAENRAALNPSQREAVRVAVARGLTVIWGPPGTGKTKTCAALIHGIVVSEAAVRRERPYAILVSGPTYKAVGELIRRLAGGLAIDPTAPCKLYLIHSRWKDDRFEVPETRGAHLEVTATLADASLPDFRQMNADLETGDHVVLVAAVTHQCARIGEQLAELRGHGQVLWPLFDLVLIDESSQADMTTAVGPLSLLKPQFQLVVAGDHLQMPPVVRCDPPLGAEYLIGSLQTYLIERFRLQAAPLLENYRSNSDIVAYTRRLGYPQELNAANPDTRSKLVRPIEESLPSVAAMGLPSSDGWSKALDPSHPMVAITYRDGRAGQANEFEADCVASLVWLLRQSSSRTLDGQGDSDHGPWDDESFWKKGVGVVTPHRAQRAQVIRSLLRSFPASNPDLIEEAVDTVERFQGGERHTILISFGVGDPDVIRGEERFLMQLERTNVAISRAMGKCILFLSDEVANHIPDDRRAAASAHALRGVVDEWCLVRSGEMVQLADGSERPIIVRWR
jgi:hypothetical protein